MKVHLATLGCKLNESELEAWARRFANDGYEIVDDAKSADIIVLNTCTVTHVAARKSRQMSRQLARANPNAKIVLTGCYVSVSPDEAKALPNVALIVPNADKDRLVQIADSQWRTADNKPFDANAISDMPYAISRDWLDADVETQVAGARPQTADDRPKNGDGRQSAVSGLRTRAFVKIEDGCNMSCTYCIIPMARGKERSRPIAGVVSEVKSLVDTGYKEIILTGVQISSYRAKVIASEAKQSPTRESEIASSPQSARLLAMTHNLRDLVTAILSETNVPRLRLTSIAPWDLDASLLELFSDNRLCRHLHLSLQSGSDTVLRRMRRPYSTAQFERAVNIAREKIPDVGITTDVIVGFPGESNVEFEQSLEFVERMQFSRVHVFPYSTRSGTVAAGLPLHVSDAVKESRVKQMQVVADASMRAFAEHFIGRELLVLWESSSSEQLTVNSKQSENCSLPTDHCPLVWSGYSDNYIRVLASSDESLENTITSANLISVIDDSAISQVIRKYPK